MGKSNNEELNTKLFDACRDGNVEDMVSLLAKGANINARKLRGDTPLHYAATYNNDPNSINLFKLLVAQKGIIIDAKDETGMTPLMLMAERGNLDAIKLMLMLGANLHEVNNKGQNAIYFAEENGKEKAFYLLLSAGGILPETRPEMLGNVTPINYQLNHFKANGRLILSYPELHIRKINDNDAYA
ncbi:MAG: ankyrin repeat protein [Rickettsiaceae bacterium]|nr:ankyrin repeat protein [Rickettsiaceae bacterium]